MTDELKAVNMCTYKPVPEVIELLEDTLAKAKAGEVTEIAGIFILPGGQLCEFLTSNTKDTPYHWIGRLRGLQMRYEHLLDVCPHCPHTQRCPAEPE